MSTRLVRSAVCLGLLVAALLPAAGQAGEMVKVELDQARIYHLAAPASTIIIGNPAIADATLQDSQTLIITGRSYGQTNLIVLDDQGETVTDAQLAVLAASENLVTVYKGSQRLSLSCLPDCQPALVPGDASSHFNGISTQSSKYGGSGSGSTATASTGTTGAAQPAATPAPPASQ